MRTTPRDAAVRIARGQADESSLAPLGMTLGRLAEPTVTIHPIKAQWVMRELLVKPHADVGVLIQMHGSHEADLPLLQLQNE